MTTEDTASKKKKPTVHSSLLTRPCGMQVYYQVVERLRSPAGTGALIGHAVHEVVRYNMRRRKKGQPLMSDEEIFEATKDSIAKRIESEGVLFTADEKEVGTKAVVSGSLDQARKLALLHSHRVAPLINPIAIEEYVRIDTGGYSHDLAGTLDIVHKDEEDGATVVRDTKTSKSKMTIATVQASIQLHLYSFMWAIHSGEQPERVCLDVLQKLKVPKAYTVEQPAPTDHGVLTARIEAFVKMLEAGTFTPIDPGSQQGAWVCTDRFCGFFERCAFGRRRVKQFAVTEGGAS